MATVIQNRFAGLAQTAARLTGANFQRAFSDEEKRQQKERERVEARGGVPAPQDVAKKDEPGILDNILDFFSSKPTDNAQLLANANVATTSKQVEDQIAEEIQVEKNKLKADFRQYLIKEGFNFLGFRDSAVKRLRKEGNKNPTYDDINSMSRVIGEEQIEKRFAQRDKSASFKRFSEQRRLQGRGDPEMAFKQLELIEQEQKLQKDLNEDNSDPNARIDVSKLNKEERIELVETKRIQAINDIMNSRVLSESQKIQAIQNENIKRNSRVRSVDNRFLGSRKTPLVNQNAGLEVFGRRARRSGGGRKGKLERFRVETGEKNGVPTFTVVKATNVDEALAIVNRRRPGLKPITDINKVDFATGRGGQTPIEKEKLEFRRKEAILQRRKDIEKIIEEEKKPFTFRSTETKNINRRLANLNFKERVALKDGEFVIIGGKRNVSNIADTKRRKIEKKYGL